MSERAMPWFAGRRGGGVLAAGVLTAGGLLLAGCAYDPQTGTYVPCCAAPVASTAGPYGPYPASLPRPQGQGYAPGYAPQGEAQAYPQDDAQQGYPQQAYPQQGYPAQGYPQQGYAPPQAGPQYAQDDQPDAGAPPPRGGHGGKQKLAQRFAAANTTGDGRLTLAQAQQSGWKMVVRNFSAIDAQRAGYVTLAELRAWKAQHRGGAMNGQG
jgi:hypothetical protein